MKTEHWHSGVPLEADQLSARPLAWKAASLIVEVMNSACREPLCRTVYFKKD